MNGLPLDLRTQIVGWLGDLGLPVVDQSSPSEISLQTSLIPPESGQSYGLRIRRPADSIYVTIDCRPPCVLGKAVATRMAEAANVNRIGVMVEPVEGAGEVLVKSTLPAKYVQLCDDLKDLLSNVAFIASAIGEGAARVEANPGALEEILDDVKLHILDPEGYLFGRRPSEPQVHPRSGATPLWGGIFADGYSASGSRWDPVYGGDQPPLHEDSSYFHGPQPGLEPAAPAEGPGGWLGGLLSGLGDLAGSTFFGVSSDERSGDGDSGDRDLGDGGSGDGGSED